MQLIIFLLIGLARRLAGWRDHEIAARCAGQYGGWRCRCFYWWIFGKPDRAGRNRADRSDHPCDAWVGPSLVDSEPDKVIKEPA